MEREKIIEEMVKDISVSLGTKCLLNIGGHCEDCKYVDEDNAEHDCQSVLVANELTDAGYRKVPDGAVVLTKEEYYDLRNKVKWAKELGASADKIRNETAREIFRKAEKKARFVDGGHYGKDRYELDLDDLKTIIKKDCGVEVDNG